jgi:hypothetical protein
MEPDLKTDPELVGIPEQLMRREPIFHRPEPGVTREDFEKITARDFWETGASGRRYSRAFVLDELEKRHASPHEDVWEKSGFHCRRLAGDVYLVTYTPRSTIREQTAEGWKIVFHQETIVAGTGPEAYPTEDSG